ncbi:MAG: formylglycine-generating enzyme family protein, partial [Elainellaceae cyanobacterium]
LGHGVFLEMVKIPSGRLVVGADRAAKGAGEREKSRREVTVPEFWMGRYPVTQAQWRSVAALPKVEQDLEPEPSNFKGDRRPVEDVSWHNAQEFCKRLSRRTGKDYRLPSEAEWEYACRAGTTTPYSFGDAITDNLANYGRSVGETADVGSYPANEWGLQDMHGNVFEWCQDPWHDSYNGAPTDGSVWSEYNSMYILRGGSWINDPRSCRSAYRGRYYADFRGSGVGFRVCCSAPRT